MQRSSTNTRKILTCIDHGQIYLGLAFSYLNMIVDLLITATVKHAQFNWESSINQTNYYKSLSRSLWSTRRCPAVQYHMLVYGQSWLPDIRIQYVSFGYHLTMRGQTSLFSLWPKYLTFVAMYKLYIYTFTELSVILCLLGKQHCPLFEQIRNVPLV